MFVLFLHMWYLICFKLSTDIIFTLKETKNITDFLLCKAHPYQKYQWHFSIQTTLQLYWKRDSGTGVFPVNFAKFLRAPLFAEHLWTTALEGCENWVLQKIEFFKTEFYFYSLSIKVCLHRGCFFSLKKLFFIWKCWTEMTPQLTKT